MRLLLINANTNSSVTELCAVAARKVARPDTEIVPLTGRFGARIIESRSEIAIAAHALLELIAEHRENADAALIAVSYDVGLEAAREIAGIPVVGITQASLVTAGLIGARIGMVTLGTPDIYRALASGYGFADRLAAIEVVDQAATAAYSNPDGMKAAVAAAAHKLVDGTNVDVVVLCGAALAGMAARLAGDIAVPVLDGVTCGVAVCEMLAQGGWTPRTVPGSTSGGVGLSDPLGRALHYMKGD